MHGHMKGAIQAHLMQVLDYTAPCCQPQSSASSEHLQEVCCYTVNAPAVLLEVLLQYADARLMCRHPHILLYREPVDEKGVNPGVSMPDSDSGAGRLVTSKHYPDSYQDIMQRCACMHHPR